MEIREVIGMEFIWMLLWALFWAICADALAQRRNRDRWTWRIAGFFFGVFAVIVLALLPERR